MFTTVQTAGQTLFAFPASLDYTDQTTYAAYRVSLTEQTNGVSATNALYTTWDLHRGHGLSWLVFAGTTAPTAATAEDNILDTIVLAPTNGYCDITRDTPYGIQIPYTRGGGTTPTNFAEAWNWATVNFAIPDPDSRIDWDGNADPGGQQGCFQIWIPPNQRQSATAGTEQQHWEVQTPLRIGPSAGGVIVGGGIGNLRTDDWAGAGTRLYWDPDEGYEDGPMLYHQGAHWHISNIAFLGHPGIGTVTKATACIGHGKVATSGHDWNGVDLGANGGTINFNSTIISVTDNTYTNCAWDSWETCIENGPSNENNCDFMTVTRANLENVTTFWLNSNAQGMGHAFQRVAGEASTFFDFQAGGKSSIEDVIAYNDGAVILNIGPSGALVGKNNNNFDLFRCGFDAQADQACIVNMEARSLGTSLGVINVHGGADAGSTVTFNENQFNLQGNVTLNVYGFKWMGRINCTPVQHTRLRIARPSIALYGCTVYASEYNYDVVPNLLSGTYSLSAYDVRQDSDTYTTGTVFARPQKVGTQPYWVADSL